MSTAVAGTEVNLLPGALWFGAGDVRLHTLLGSCVAITLWHPRYRYGGMCHFMLPGRSRSAGSRPDGRYATEAMDCLVQSIVQAGLRPAEFEAKLFGGGRMYPDCGSVLPPGSPFAVHERNIEAARELLASYRLTAAAEHLGGRGHRQVHFELATGDAWVRHASLQPHLHMTGRDCT